MFRACLCNFQDVPFFSQTRLKSPSQVWPSKRSFTKAQWGQRWPLQANSADRLPHTQGSESVDNSFFHLWGHMLTIKRQRPLKQQCRLVRKASWKICNVSYDSMTTSRLRTQSTLVSEAFHADEMFHKHLLVRNVLMRAAVLKRCKHHSHTYFTHHKRNKPQGSPLRSGLRLRSTGGGWHSVMCIGLRGGVLGLERKPMWAGGGTCFPREENSTVPGVMGT